MPYIDYRFAQKKLGTAEHQPIKRKADFTAGELAAIQQRLADRMRQADPIKLEIYHELQGDDVQSLRS